MRGQRLDGFLVRDPPAEESTVTQRELSEIIKRYSIPASWCPRVARPGEFLYSFSDGFLAVSESLFEVGGLRLPYLPIFDVLSAEYGFVLSQLPPNGWRFINGLALLCHHFDFVITVNILRYFLKMNQCSASSNFPGIFQFQYQNRKFRPMGTPLTNKG